MQEEKIEYKFRKTRVRYESLKPKTIIFYILNRSFIKTGELRLTKAITSYIYIYRLDVFDWPCLSDNMTPVFVLKNYRWK